jgi:undecaprenyl diphosphate synthase
MPPRTIPKTAASAGKLPVHVGIIMDGNGRWAEERKILRSQGHLEGLKAAKRIVKAASDAGIRYLTLYVFSTENWKRTADEVGFIMGLVKQYLRGELDFYRENRIRIRHAGDAAGLPPDIATELEAAIEETKNFPGLQVILALNYGGRDEIVRAVRRLLEGGRNDTPASGLMTAGNVAMAAALLSQQDISINLDNPDIPDPDLIIRSAGEKRTSNFLLWEGAYSEYYFSGVLWPDFTETEFGKALEAYGERTRKFGGVT